ncbi:hypothetical protein TWF694_006930 [Orbilia ellipsospora]|uniref:Small ribosomal subunit protein bS18m n=1 Tax=Orbilia ellipsospora TaxID=2528407 RepID=A0AAV9XP92_9PEZI
MPPRPSAAIVKTVYKGSTGTLLPFLYPISSRRLISSTASLRQDGPDDNQKDLLNMIKNFPKSQSQPDSLPRINETSQSATPFHLQQRKDAYNDLHKTNKSTTVLVDQLTQAAQRRKGIEENLDRINHDIFRYSAPVAERSYLSPKDLSYEEFLKWQDGRKTHLRSDVFEILQENPLAHYKNFNLLKDFMTTAGRIKHRSLTNLSNRNQRKMSKAIRRAVGIGLLPSVHRHPSILMTEQRLAVEGYKAGGYVDRPREEGVASRLPFYATWNKS